MKAFHFKYSLKNILNIYLNWCFIENTANGVETRLVKFNDVRYLKMTTVLFHLRKCKICFFQLTAASLSFKMSMKSHLEFRLY